LKEVYQCTQTGRIDQPTGVNGIVWAFNWFSRTRGLV